jgi:hypothetical protein
MVLTELRRARSRVSRVGDPAWVKALFIAPAVVGSFATLVLLGRSTSFRRWLGRSTPEDLDAIRASLLGLGSRRITALLGPPPAATSAPAVTWYYPVAEARRTAMAISFENDRAVRVEFFQSPG